MGETINYEITVTNDGNLTITDITVTDELTGNEGENAWTIDALAPGKSQTFEAKHEVTEADIRAGSVVNVATATGTSPDPDEPDVWVDPGEREDPTRMMEPSLFVEKTVLGKKDGYKLGETITYQITVINSGNVTMTDIVVEDPLTGLSRQIGTLKLGEISQTIETTYVVTEADILKGNINNEATASGMDTEGNRVDYTASQEVSTGEKNGRLAVSKVATTKPANGTAYALGETIKYQITVTNDGNLTITNVVVTDELTGDQWTVESLEPGASKTFETEYEVTQVDILAGSVVNVATATGTSPDPDEPDVPVDPGENEVPTGPKNGHLTVAKDTTSRPANGDTYVVGETIKYEITVINDGNLTITDIIVTDELTGDQWTIDSLSPDEMMTYNAEHIVTEADILAGSVINEATATGTSPDPETPDVPVTPGSTEDLTEERRTDIEIIKRETSSSQFYVEGVYWRGDIITYCLEVTNTGNIALIDVAVIDIMKTSYGGERLVDIVPGDGYTTDEYGDAFIDELAPGQTVSINASYIVTDWDISETEGKLINTALATGKAIDNNLDTPSDEASVESPIEYHTYGTVVIHKSNIDGLTDEPVITNGFVTYVGIFEDEYLTQLIDVKKIRFDNSSEGSIILENVETGTYYLAEVDENGYVIPSGEWNGGFFNPGYTLGTYNGDSSTLDMDHALELQVEESSVVECSIVNLWAIVPEEAY